MCGITGFTSKRADKAEILTAMMDAIAHRGPDGAGQYTDEQVALGLGARTAAGAEPDPVACGDLLAECWEKILELIQNYDLDFMAHA